MSDKTAMLAATHKNEKSAQEHEDNSEINAP